MQPEARIVIRIPLNELWTPAGPIHAVRLRELDRAEVADLLRIGTLQFVRADVGGPLEWIDPSGRFRFWESEVRDRVVDADTALYLDDYPGGYCHVASEWRAEGRPPIVLLERRH